MLAYSVSPPAPLHYHPTKNKITMILKEFQIRTTYFLEIDRTTIYVDFLDVYTPWSTSKLTHWNL